MKLPIKIALVAGAIAVAGIASYVFCAKSGETPSAKQTGVGQKEKPAVRTAGQDAPKPVQQAKPVQQEKPVAPKTVPKGPAGQQAANGETRPSRPSHRDEIEARRREREAFRKMSPEEQRRFREKKRAEFLAREHAPSKKGAHAKGRGSRGPAAAGPGGAPVPQGENTAELSPADREKAMEELRQAAVKARAEYERSMDSEERSQYKRRSLGYWMSRVERRRERSALREAPSQPEASQPETQTNTRKE